MDKQAAQVLVTELHDEIKRAHGKEMHATPTLLLLAAKMTIEELLREVTVLDTTLALREAAPPAALAVPAYYPLGETIYTPPSEEVRFCYSRGQPNNINASRLGEACRRAAEKPGGDYIDGGLSLLKELEARGYGVFRFAKSAHEQAQQPAAPAVPAEGLTVKEAWWAGARAALGLPGDTPREQVESAFAIAKVLSDRDEQAQQPAALAVPANVTPMRQPRADLARLVESINAAVYANGDGLSVTEAIGALELAKLELLKEQEQ